MAPDFRQVIGPWGGRGNGFEILGQQMPSRPSGSHTTTSPAKEVIEECKMREQVCEQG